MKCVFAAGAVVLMAWVSSFVSHAQATPCLMITLTGTQGGPPAFKGLAGPGTLVRYGEDSNNCSAVKLQSDAGRGHVAACRACATAGNACGRGAQRNRC